MQKRDFTIRTSSEDETLRAGREVAPRLSGVVLLNGSLGAGKTTLVRGIVEGIAGVRADEVSSPTFTLIHDYGSGVFHLDLYRLETEREIESLGLDEIVDSARLVLIEWGDKLGRLSREARAEIRIEHNTEHDTEYNDDSRLIHVSIWDEADAAGNQPT